MTTIAYSILKLELKSILFSKANSTLSEKIDSFSIIILLFLSFNNFNPLEYSNNFIPTGSYPKILFSILHLSLKLIIG